MSISGICMRGTTPTHIFTIPFNVSLIADLRISYGQENKELLVKCKNDCTLEGKKITVTLSQEDTFKFDCNKQLQIQVRTLSVQGEVLNSDLIILAVGKCLNSEVLKVET